jgi:hypothetical protein
VPRIHFFSLGASPIFLKIKQALSSASRPDSPVSPEWRALYVAALFEQDEGRMIERIDQAKRALVVRARELFLSEGDHRQEQDAIEDALQFLHVLQKCAFHAHAMH